MKISQLKDAYQSQIENVNRACANDAKIQQTLESLKKFTESLKNELNLEEKNVPATLLNFYNNAHDKYYELINYVWFVTGLRFSEEMRDLSTLGKPNDFVQNFYFNKLGEIKEQYLQYSPEVTNNEKEIMDFYNEILENHINLTAKEKRQKSDEFVALFCKYQDSVFVACLRYGIKLGAMLNEEINNH